MLNTIKALLGITSNEKDVLIKALMSQTTNYVLNYCHLDSIPVGLEGAIVDIVVIRYNLLGNEGISGESYSGVNFSYDSSIPSNIISQLNSYRKVRTL